MRVSTFKIGCSKFLDKLLRFFFLNMESKQNPLHVTESAFDLVDLMKFKNINLLRFFLLTDGKSSEKKVENREINGIPTQIQIWDIDEFYSLEKRR